MINNALKFTGGCLVAGGGIALAYKAGSDLYTKRQEKKKRDAKKALFDNHNLNYSIPYGMTYLQYYNNVAVAVFYVQTYPYLVLLNKEYEVLMCPFAIMIHNDVALMLAAAIAEKEFRQDYPRIFTRKPIRWLGEQSRYVTEKVYVSKTRDTLRPEYSVAAYLQHCLHLRECMKLNKDSSCVKFIRKQVKIIKHLLVEDNKHPVDEIITPIL
jgi:hypothetical protein